MDTLLCYNNNMVDFINTLTPYSPLYFLWHLLLLLILIDMTNRRRDPAIMISWFLVLLTLPYLGIFFYFLIGRRKIRETPLKSSFSMPTKEDESELTLLENVLNRYGMPKATEGNEFQLISSATEAYGQLMKAIEEAEESIYLATYIFDDDAVTKKIIEALAKKSQEGIDVRLLIDSFGSLKLYLWSKALEPLYSAGVKVEFFMPLRPFWYNTHINLRLHRKIYLFDKKIVFSGGMNLSSTYLGKDSTVEQWDDLLFSIKGSAVAYYYNVFISDWNFTVDVKEPLLSPSQSILNIGEERIQVVPSGPDIDSDTFYDALLVAIYAAKERIWIVSPYFIPNNSLLEALRIAHKKGVEVKLITPKVSDNIFIDIARRSYLHEIHDWGGKVALYHKKMLHAKAFLIDNSTAIVGTLNFDNRSFFLNYEIVSIGYSLNMIREVEEWMLELLDKSTLGMESVGKVEKFLENLGRIIAPQI